VKILSRSSRGRVRNVVGDLRGGGVGVGGMFWEVGVLLWRDFAGDEGMVVD